VRQGGKVYIGRGRGYHKENVKEAIRKFLSSSVRLRTKRSKEESSPDVDAFSERNS